MDFVVVVEGMLPDGTAAVVGRDGADLVVVVDTRKVSRGEAVDRAEQWLAAAR